MDDHYRGSLAFREAREEGNRDLEIATCRANHPETPQPLQSRFLNRGSLPKLAHFPHAFSTHGLGLGSSWGETPILLLHLAYSEEDLKFKSEIPPFPEAPNHKSQCTPVSINFLLKTKHSKFTKEYCTA